MREQNAGIKWEQRDLPLPWAYEDTAFSAAFIAKGERELKRATLSLHISSINTEAFAYGAG